MDLLTRLVLAAYSAHLSHGLRCWVTHRTVEDTARRFSSSCGYVAQANGEYVGAITVRPPQPTSPVVAYRDPRTWTICQLAIAPSHRGRGLGKALHDAAVGPALRAGGSILALDTAAPAQRLIEMYRAWGYQVVGSADWRPHTNYVSVIMSRRLSFS